MSLEQLTTPEEVRAFLKGTQAVVFTVATDKKERYQWVQKSLVKLRYTKRGKADKGLITPYLMKVTGYSHAQTKRLIQQYVKIGKVTVKATRRNRFERRYSATDIRLLAAMDERHHQPSGAVVRKLFGYTHIPQQYTANFADFNCQQVYRYINFHRPCYFPTTITDSKGKERKQYRYEDMMTPYEKLRSLPQASQYLKPGITFDELDAFARKMTDNEAAEQVNSARDYLFTQLHEQLQRTA